MKYKTERYKKAKRKLLLLDYDGTLVNYAPTPDAATPPEYLLKLLLELNKSPQTHLVLITGRGHQDIDKLLGHLPIDMVAEHGGMFKEKGVWKKKHTDAGAWKNEVLPVLNWFVQHCPDSFIEEKDFALAWHYRNAESAPGYDHSRKLIRILEKIAGVYSLKLLDGNKVVEIMAGEIGKGKAVKNLAEQKDYEYILCIGDDRTDEEMFEYLSPYAHADTVKVGKGDTAAKYRLKQVSDVLELLEQLSGMQ